MSPIGRSVLAAAALLTVAVLVYGAALVENVFIGRGGLDGPCTAHVHSVGEEGGVRTRVQSYFPPRTTCVIRDFRRDTVRTAVHEWPWLPAALLGCVVGAVALLAVLIAAQRRV